MGFFERLNNLPKDKTKEELDEHYSKMNLEKNDFLAMVLAGFRVFTPILIVLLAVLLLMMWFFRAI
jgi:hypothetical protein